MYTLAIRHVYVNNIGNDNLNDIIVRSYNNIMIMLIKNRIH
jgi:hypothetical protein